MFLWAPKRRSQERKTRFAGRIDQHEPLQYSVIPLKRYILKNIILLGNISRERSGGVV